jgi:hypothetical protein
MTGKVSIVFVSCEGPWSGRVLIRIELFLKGRQATIEPKPECILHFFPYSGRHFLLVRSYNASITIYKYQIVCYSLYFVEKCILILS